jgi:phosphatidylglycerophosphate synthase
VKRPGALVFTDHASVTIGGLTLPERVALLARRAGLGPVRVWGQHVLAPESVARLRSRGVTVLQQSPAAAPLEGVGDLDDVVVVGPAVLFEPRVLNDLMDRAGGDTAEPAAACESGLPLLLYLPAGAIADVRACSSLDAMLAGLAARGAVRDVPLEGRYCRRVERADPGPSIERGYIRHLNGGEAESYFTKRIRRFSVPLTSLLVRLGARPTQVTAGGLLLAVTSAWFLARGSYGAGLLGAVLYYASMVFDCSDGEVARLTVRDSRFGAWLETIVDYLTYFLILGALTIASQRLPGAGSYRVAAAVALVGTVVVVAVAGYLRHRVAAADPGRFDDASAMAMASAARLHRFARWGRQWIKRSTVAHLVVFLALVHQLPVLLYLWAFGAVLASVVILAVEPFVARRVSVAPAGIQNVDAGG